MDYKKSITLIIFSLLASIAPALAREVQPIATVESATYRFEFTNDVFFNKDNEISSTWSLQKHSAVATSWDTIEETPYFIGRWGKFIPTLTRDDLFYRSGIGIGQIIQTPEDLSRSDLIKNDVPYAGILALQASWYAYNDYELRGFQITLGLTGTPSLAEQTQKFIHRIINSDYPHGWYNQLSTEPVVNFNYLRKLKLLRWGSRETASIDVTASGNAGLGNLFIQANIGLEMRFGYNMPGGFINISDPVGFGMYLKPNLKRPNLSEPAVYASFMVRGIGFARNLLWDGNTFSHSHSINSEAFIGQWGAGLNFEYRNLAIQLNVAFTSKDVNTVGGSEGREKLGSIILEWRF